ncbi:beta-1,4-N-acetylgalactosaminyltransferase bre-4 [Diabrotica virgifera virgifera]|uniref:Beta-1,4-N-acetylgalactosaminyltransferase n=1 Tax=Diabrotica virgifera virgifera TaxID=50390 RepID=A0ABM5JPD5_DIAVI|nr:beta-1,4-N-acetylgalactosaminyltransferase bre-4 [Diabrotica virgifera virgifera]
MTILVQHIFCKTFISLTGIIVCTIIIFNVITNITPTATEQSYTERFISNETQVQPDIQPKSIEENEVSFCKDVASSQFVGRVLVLRSPSTIKEMEHQFDWLQAGGHWHPPNCRAKQKLAVIVPFRNREIHLSVFLRHMHPFLRQQQLDYTIFVIEQQGDKPFNRGMLMNIGFEQAMSMDQFDCFIFHDVDLLPENNRNLYMCGSVPRHMSVAVDVLRYRLPYKNIFGGVTALTTQHFSLVNGFSNSFWGWGGEDDDIFNRLQAHKLDVTRYSSVIARYKMLRHQKAKPNPQRYNLLKEGKKKYTIDGLNSLHYKVLQKQKKMLYTWILVDINTK